MLVDYTDDPRSTEELERLGIPIIDLNRIRATAEREEKQQHQKEQNEEFQKLKRENAQLKQKQQVAEKKVTQIRNIVSPNPTNAKKPLMRSVPKQPNHKEQLKREEERLKKTRENLSKVLRNQVKSGTAESYQKYVKPLSEYVRTLEQSVERLRKKSATLTKQEDSQRRMTYLKKQRHQRKNRLSIEQDRSR